MGRRTYLRVHNQEPAMQIGAAAKASGVSAKMIRHYESIGLIPAADRRDSNYRDYGAAEVHRLAFIRRARDLGFSMDEIRGLLELWSDSSRTSADVKALTEKHILDLEQRIAALGEMRDTLRPLVSCCDGDHRPDCPIIESLEGAVPLPRLQHHHAHEAAANLKHTH
jgi:Cu(I)-responsive transcriptional regulator